MSEEPSIVARSERLLGLVREQWNADARHETNELGDTAIPFLNNQGDIADISETGGYQEPPLSPVRPPVGDPTTTNDIKQFFLNKQSAKQSDYPSDVYGTSQQMTPPDTPGGTTTTIFAGNRYKTLRTASRRDRYEREDTPNIDTELFTSRPSVRKGKISKKKNAEEEQKPIFAKANVAVPADPTITQPLAGGRDIAEEGFYVPNQPRAKKCNAKRLQNRLLWDDPNGEYFFGADGNMRNDAPVVQESAYIMKKKKKNNAEQEEVHSDFFPGEIWGIEDLDVTRTLHIEIHKVKFLVHPLCTVEDLLDNKIRQLYDAIMKDAEFPRARYYKERIKAFRTELDQLDDSPEGERQERLLLEQICTAHEMKDAEEHNLMQMRDSIVTAWNELRDIREETGITVQNLGLKWQIRNFTPAEKAKQEENFERHLQHRAQEMCRLAELKGAKDVDLDATVEELRKRHADLGLHLPGDSLWKPVIYDNQNITPTQSCPREEQLRRQRLKSARIYVKIHFGDANVQSLQVPVSDTFDAEPDMAVQLNVTQVPEAVGIEIWESGYTRDRLLATVQLRTTIGETPDIDVFEFTAPPPGGVGRLVVGSVLARCFVQPMEEDRILVRPPNEEGNKKKELALDPSRFMSVPKLLEWAETHDPNDPYMATMLASVRAQRTAERVAGRFKLDPVAEQTSFAAICPTTISQQIQAQIQRIQQAQMEEEMRRMKMGEDPDQPAKKIKRLPNGSLALESVVDSGEIGTFGSLVTWMKDFFRRRRPMQPVLENTEPLSYIESYTKLVVRLNRVLNAVQRTGVLMGPNIEATEDFAPVAGSEYPELFIRVIFGDEIRVTSVSYDDWSETFEFPICEEGEEPDMEDLSQRTIRFDLFDHVVFQQMDGADSDDLSEEHFLSSLEIPLSAIWTSGEISGNLPMHTPPMQLGYTAEDKAPIILNASIAFNPRTIIPTRNPTYDSTEPIPVRERCDKLLKKFAKFASDRRIVFMGNRTSGETALLCRLVTPCALPEGIDQPLQIIRAVSSIPFIPGSHSGIWCTMQEFLDQRGGDIEEHALLLCNMLKAIDLDAYIALGSDVLCGLVAYVLVIKPEGEVLIDPISGSIYDVDNFTLPMTSIGTVFNDENIWVNVQKSAHPLRIDYNLLDKKQWRPFFDSSFPFVPSANDIEKVSWGEPDDDGAHQLEMELTASIRASIEEDLSMAGSNTKWNEDLSVRMRSALDNLQRVFYTQQYPETQQILEYITKKFNGYRLNGAPFEIPYTDAERVINEIRMHGTFVTCFDDAEFGLAIKVVPVPHRMFTVWVFLASAQRVPIVAPPAGADVPSGDEAVEIRNVEEESEHEASPRVVERSFPAGESREEDAASEGSAKAESEHSAEVVKPPSDDSEEKEESSEGKDQSEGDKEDSEKAPSEKEDSEKEESEKEESEKEQSEKEDSEKEQSEKEQSEKEDSEKEESEKEKSEKEDSEKEESEKEQTEKEDSEKEDSEKEQSEKEQSEKEDSEKEDSEKEQSEKEDSEKEDSEKEESEKEQTEKAASDKAESEKEASDKEESEKPASEKSESEVEEKEESEKEQPEKEESEKVASDKAESVKEESEKAASEKEESEKPASEKAESDKEEKPASVKAESDKEEEKHASEKAESEKEERSVKADSDVPPEIHEPTAPRRSRTSSRASRPRSRQRSALKEKAPEAEATEDA